MRHINTHVTKKCSRGSVLILSVVIATVLFSIGAALASIFEKDVRRQSYGKRSQTALSIANTAFECALYNDFRRDTFQGSLTPAGITVDCGDRYQVRSTDLSGVWGGLSYTPPVHSIPGVGVYTFVVVASEGSDLSLLTDPVPCARVIVSKVCSQVSGGFCAGVIDSFIESKGYDRCLSGNLAERDLVRRFRVYY